MRERYNIEPGGKWLGMDISVEKKEKRKYKNSDSLVINYQTDMLGEEEVQCTQNL